MEPHAADVSCEVGSKQGIDGAQPRPSSSLCLELELPSIFVGQRHLRRATTSPYQPGADVGTRSPTPCSSATALSISVTELGAGF